jgi:membrane protein YqaA with SNARE-associated domain
MEGLAELGYLGLLLSSFLAATILPLSSEVVLGVLLVSDLSPVVLVGVATVGNVSGSCLNYALGWWGGALLGKKVSKISSESFTSAIERMRKYGVWSLLLAWVPVIGDPLTLAAGVLRIDLKLFLLLVTTGKLARYGVIAYLIVGW